MNNVFYRTKPIIGLDFSRTGVRVVSVNREKMLVHGYGSVELDPSKISDNLETSSGYLTQKIDSLLKENIIGKLDSNRVVLGVPTMRTFARTFTIPAAQEAKVKQAVSLEVEQYVPMPLENLYVDHLVISRTEKELTVLMCAVPKKFIDDLLGVLKALGLEVVVIEPSIYAIARLLEVTKEGGLPTVIVDLSPSDTDIAIFDGAVRVTGGLNIGGNTLTLDIAKKMDLTIENAHQLKVLSGLNPGPRQAKVSAALRPSLLKIVNETKKVMRFYTERFPGANKLEQILIVGSGSNVPGLGEFFTNELVMPARVASPWQALDFAHIDQPAKHLRARLATAAGLALVDPKEAVK